MKVINSIKDWWNRQLRSDKAAFITFIVAMVLQVIFAIFIPCFVLKLGYESSYIWATLFLLFFSAIVLFATSDIFYHYLEKHFKTIAKKVVIIISIVLVSFFTVIPVMKTFDNLIVTRTDYNVLEKKAEKVENKDDIYEYADYFSYDKDLEKHYVDFKNGDVRIDVTYDKDFKIVSTERTDGIASTIFLFVMAVAITEPLSMAISSIVFTWHKFVDKKMQERKSKKKK